jgi:hypothetical protein
MNIENSDSFGNYLIHGIDEIGLPSPVSWWPSAPGWQVLGFIAAAWLVWRGIRRATRWWRNRYRREALRQLQQHQQQDRVAVLPYYLKVTALQAYPREEVASLSGSDWLVFLDAHYSGPSFAEGPGKQLLSVSYLPQDQWQLDDEARTALIDMSLQWIATHREPSHV